MRKSISLLTILLGALLAGIYGIINDQVSYTVSSEYYTKFKFLQFQIASAYWNRVGAGCVGFLATWWFGLIMGFIFIIISRVFKYQKLRMKIILRCYGLAFAICFFFSAAGLAAGKLYSETLSENHMPFWVFDMIQGIVDYQNFVAVGIMHDIGYLGGLIAILVCSIFLVDQNRKLKNRIQAG